MKILYYEWNDNVREDMEAALSEWGYEMECICIPCLDYEHDTALAEHLKQAVEKGEYAAIFSFDFFPVLAKAAEQLKISYLSWIYDSPHWTLCSPAVWSKYNYIYTFDCRQYRMLKERGISHVYHLPLAVNTDRINCQLGFPQRAMEYRMEAGFVGSLYEKNQFDRIVYLPEHLKGYLDGIMDIQKKVFGADLLTGLLAGPVTKELEQYVKLDMDESYTIEKHEMYADMLYQKITSKERIAYLNRISEQARLSLFTMSDASLVPKACFEGTVSYEKEMPETFCQTKVNLNMTLRSIQSGIPLRALDIMGAGGFLLSNYQPELAEYFVDGEELALYEDEEHLLELVSYYLEHDKRRREIAHQGWEKVMAQFSYKKQVGKMIASWEKERKTE